MIWTLTHGATVYAIADGTERIYRCAGDLSASMRQSTQVSAPMRSDWPVAFPDRAQRTLSFDIPVTFPACASYEEAAMQALDVPVQCPRGGVLTGLHGTSQRVYAQAWVDAISAKNMGVTNHFTFSITAVNPTEATLSPLALMDARYVANLPAITGLTGGTASDLDGLITVDVAAGFQTDVFAAIGALNQKATFRLYAGTDATNTDPDAGPVIVRPVDYHASTNAKVWKRLDA